jgi:hypothetical protein
VKTVRNQLTPHVRGRLRGGIESRDPDPFGSRQEGNMAKPREREHAGHAGKAAPRPEFSRPVDVSRIGRLEHRMSIRANADERAALARRFDLIELTELAADLVVKKRGDGLVEVSGRWRARLAQPSVVSLEPVWADLADDARLYFGGAPARRSSDVDPLDEEGWPEPIEEGHIDLGEAVAQMMAVALDPYPRLPEEAAPR